ncbi:MAG: O-antigen ligase family protein [Flavobacteriales bacterium]
MKNIVLSILLCTIFISTVFGIGPNLYPLRIFVPIALVYFSIYLFQKVILYREKIEVKPFIFLSLVFFIYTFFHTSIVTYLRMELLGNNYEINSIINFTFLLFYILLLHMVSIALPNTFLSKAKSVITIFYFLYAVYAFYEIFTGNHLAVSNLYDAPNWLRFSPTVVYNNSNDFAAIFTLMFIFLISEYDKKKRWSFLWIVFFFLLHIFIIYKSQSRLSLLMTFLFFGYRYPKKFIYSGVIGLLIIILMGLLTNNMWYAQLIDDLSKLKTDLSFSERQSTFVRMYLYKHALLSVPSSFGLGYGIDYSAEYYRTINDANLYYITNPHSFIFELLINSGLVSCLFYIILNGYLLLKNWINKNYDLIIQIVIFNLILFSSSSSLFIWPIYLFFIIYICKSLQEERL